MTVQVCSVYMNSNQTNATGDGTIVYIPFDTENFDVGSNYDTTNHKYIAPEDGYYLVNGAVEVSNLGAAHTSMWIMVLNSTTNFQNYTDSLNPSSVRVNTGGIYYYMKPFCTIMHMSQGDELQVLVRVTNSTKTVTVNGGYRETTLHVALLNW